MLPPIGVNYFFGDIKFDETENYSTANNVLKQNKEISNQQ